MDAVLMVVDTRRRLHTVIVSLTAAALNSAKDSALFFTARYFYKLWVFTD
jgi:hypothetical protein